MNIDGKVKYFNFLHGTDLWEDYSDIVEECNDSNFEDFEGCVKAAIISQQISQIYNQFGVTFTESQLLELAGNDCNIYSSDFIECAMAGVLYVDTDGDSDSEMTSILPYSCKSFYFITNPFDPSRAYSRVNDLPFIFYPLGLGTY